MKPLLSFNCYLSVAQSLPLLKKIIMIRKLASGEYRIYSRKKNPKTNKRRNLGTFSSLAAAKKHEKEIQYFKKHWANVEIWKCGNVKMNIRCYPLYIDHANFSYLYFHFFTFSHFHIFLAYIMITNTYNEKIAFTYFF